jgi:type I restriction enzyme M protein
MSTKNSPATTSTNSLKKFATIPLSAETDVFGKIYEFFPGEFALGEGQKGGEFYTPPAVVRLMVEVIEPTGGKLLDPACGSGGMFVQSANYLRKNAPAQLNKLSVYGYEKSRETARLAKMNAKINGLRAFISTANTFETQDDFQNTYDYVLANPPFNVKEVKAETVEHKTHFNAYGLPKNKGKAKGDELIPNANYLWISLFTSALKPHGKAGLVMANSASDASGAELDIRRKLIEEGQISSMLTLSSNMFNTVTLPATLWFFEKQPNKEPISLYAVEQEALPTEATLLQAAEPNEVYRKDEEPLSGNNGEVQVLFVDARNIFTQISRKQRTFTDEQVQNFSSRSRKLWSPFSNSRSLL